jgi:protocatechuate 3,4-dioxygenase beta subunit
VNLVSSASRTFKRIIFAAALCVVVAAAPAPSAQSAATNTPGPYRIAGVLVNSATGEPIRRGVVQALDDSGHAVASSITDNDGRFHLDRLAAAKYQLSASRRGFIIQSYDEHDEFATSIVTGPDQDTTHLNFRLTPNAVIYGVVSDDNGDPVANARVMIFKRPRHPGTGERIVNVNTATTDDTGAYELSNIAAGEYFLAVVADPWYAVHDGTAAKRNSALDVVYPVTYFDSTSEEQSATPIDLSGGMRQEVNFSLHAVPALRLSIAVPRKPDGSLVRPELQQTIFGNVIASQSAGFLDALQTGSVEMGGIAPGQYELTQGDPPHIVDLNLTASQQVDPESGSSEGSLRGTVRMISGSGLPEQLTMTLDRIDSGPGQGQYVADAGRGSFEFVRVPPGDYALSATGAEKAIPVVAVGAGARLYAGNTITVRERMPEITVALSPAETRIQGFAKKDGKGFAGAMMVLLPRNPAQWRSLTRRDQTDSDGSFGFRDVAPGQYTVVAIEDGWPLDWTSSTVMARYLPAGTNVTVTANSGKTIQLSGPVTVQQR